MNKKICSKCYENKLLTTTNFAFGLLNTSRSGSREICIKCLQKEKRNSKFCLFILGIIGGIMIIGWIILMIYLYA